MEASLGAIETALFEIGDLLAVLALGLLLVELLWLRRRGRLGKDRLLEMLASFSTLVPALDRNYGAVLMLWDRLFGTYRAEVETPVYGLTWPLDSKNPLKVHFREAVLLLRDLRRADSPGEMLGLLFRRPGWRPRRRRAENRATTG